MQIGARSFVVQCRNLLTNFMQYISFKMGDLNIMNLHYSTIFLIASSNSSKIHYQKFSSNAVLEYNY